MHRKGRAAANENLKAARAARWQVPLLSDDQIRDIRTSREVDGATYEELAIRHGVKTTTIARVIKRERQYGLR
jgi:hypothetical protein